MEGIDENGIITKKAKKNPFASVRKALYSEDYDKVRDTTYATNEGILKK